MATTLSAAFTTTVRMVDRIHRRTTVGRANPLPAITSGLADDDVHVIRVTDGTDRGSTGGRHAAEKISAGASLVQIYSGFIYKGPALIRESVDAIAALR